MAFSKYKILFLIVLLILTGCKSANRKKDFAMMEEQKELLEEIIGNDTTPKPIYITGTKPVWEAEADKLLFDIYRIKTDYYPDSIQFHARVYDSSGNFITNLANPYKTHNDIEYFTALNEQLGKHYNIREENIPQFTVREFGAGDSIPFNIALTVDYSGSMMPVMGAIFEGTEIFIDMKFPTDNIALASFNRNFILKSPLQNDKQNLLKIFREKKNEGKGAFSSVKEAIINSVRIFEKADLDDPRILVVFTDGDDNYSKRGLGEIIARAKRENINVFVVAFGYPKSADLKIITSNTGGKYYQVHTKEEMIKAFRDIYLSLRYYYLFTYKPPKFWGWHTIFADLKMPSFRDKTLVATGEYDTSDLWKDVGDEFTLPILFDYNKYDIKEESIHLIDEIVDNMLSRPRLRLEIQGHTDNIGGVDFNQELSEKRAFAVYEAIISKGISEDRLRYKGFGLSQPVATNDTEENRAKNRRTNFVVLAK
ncbi:MAG: OmpA family protein [Bacteroidetes bacterium]|nr:OmpA family protein [Bacteroidota bacterium]